MHSSIEHLVAVRSQLTEAALVYRQAVLDECLRRFRLATDASPETLPFVGGLKRDLHDLEARDRKESRIPLPILVDLADLSRPADTSDRREVAFKDRVLAQVERAFSPRPVLGRWLDQHLKTSQCRLVLTRGRGAVVGASRDALVSLLNHVQTHGWTSETVVLDREGTTSRFDSAEGLAETWFDVFQAPAPHPEFRGREAEIALLRRTLDRPTLSFAAITQAVIGLGGVGKTQLARAYARQRRGDYEAVFWARADSVQNLQQDFAIICDALGLIVRETLIGADAPDRSDSNQTPEVLAVLRWMTSRSSSSRRFAWLLILDNVEDPDAIRSFLPQAGAGHVILTSRQDLRVVVPHGQDPITVRTWSDDDAADYMLNALSKHQRAPHRDDRATARRIAHELGGLPALIAGAVRYIAVMDLSFKEYLELYWERRTSMIDYPEALPADYRKSARVTWGLAVEAIEKVAHKDRRCELSPTMLRVASYLHPDGISLSVLKSAKDAVEGAHRRKGVPVHRATIQEVLKPLLRFGLLDQQSDSTKFSMHRTVQQAFRDMMSPSHLRQTAELVIDAIDRVSGLLEVSFATVERQAPMIAHAHFVAGLLIHPEPRVDEPQDETDQLAKLFEFEEAAALLVSTGFVLSNFGREEEAKPLFERAREIRGERDDRQTARALLWEADNIDRLGDHAKARVLYLRALEMVKRALGPRHADVGQVMNSLGINHMDDHKYSEAERWFRQALDVWRGGDRSMLGAAWHNLAMLEERRAGSKAEEYYRQAVEHLDLAGIPYMTMEGNRHLAEHLAGKGRFADAIPFLRKACAAAEGLEGRKAKLHQILRSGERALGRSGFREEAAEWEETGGRD